MGKCETASASVGLKILLSYLLSQMNEPNGDVIKRMLHDGCIEDCTECFNEVYQRILESARGSAVVRSPGNHLGCREYLMTKFITNGSYYKSKCSSQVEPDLK